MTSLFVRKTPTPRSPLTFRRATRAEVLAHPAVRDIIEDRDFLSQTSGDLCPRCGWRGVRPPDPCAFCAVEDLRREVEDLRRLRTRLTFGDPPDRLPKGRGEDADLADAWFVIFYHDADPPTVRCFLGEGAENAARHVHRELAGNWTGAFLARPVLADDPHDAEIERRNVEIRRLLVALNRLTIENGTLRRDLQVAHNPNWPLELPLTPAAAQCYEIIGAKTDLVIGYCHGESGKRDVLAEEPPETTFRAIPRERCHVCHPEIEDAENAPRAEGETPHVRET